MNQKHSAGKQNVGLSERSHAQAFGGELDDLRAKHSAHAGH
jgi:hypothetical protein